MDRLPDEIILRIATFIAITEWQLLELEKVSMKLRCIIQDQTLWYRLFQQNFKNWGYHVPYACRRPLIDWRAFVIHLAKQRLRSRSLTFDFVSDEPYLDPLINRKRKIHELARSSSSPSPSPPSYKNLPRHQELTSVDTDQHQSTDYTTGDSLDMASPSINLTPYGSSSPSIPLTEPCFDRDSLRRLFTRSSSSSSPSSSSFRIQDPLVVDINRATQTGMVATGKHRKAAGMRSDSHSRQSEYKILFWDYPSWRLIRELEINFVPPEITCQVVGIQTVRIKEKNDNDPILSASDDSDQSYQSIRLFALAIGKPIYGHVHMNDGNGHPEFENDFDENDDRVDLWQAVLIYRLFDNGATQCLANVPLDGRFMGREIFFFSDYSWTYGDTDEGTVTATTNDDEPTNHIKQRSVKDWLQMVAPEHSEYDPHFTLFMLAIGPTSPDTNGCGKLVQCDLRGNSNIVDPSLTSVAWNPALRRIVPARRGSMPLYIYRQQQQQQQHSRENMAGASMETNINTSSPPPVSAKIIHTAYLGPHVSCMTHFRYPIRLNHLICTGSYDNNELSIYDWRFGIKVGTLPWKAEQRQQPSGQQQQHRTRNNRRTPLHHQHLRHHAERHPPHVPPPTRPDHVGDNHLEPAELNDAVALLDQLLARNQRDAFDQLTGQMIQMDAIDGDDDEDDDNVAGDDDNFETDFRHEVRPWGLESTMVLPPYWDHRTPTNEELAHRGFRLIAVGDNRMNRLEIKVWDISFLLKQAWDPLQRRGDEDMDSDDDTTMVDLTATIPADGDEDWQKKAEWTKLFPWWRRGSRHLRLLGLRMIYERVQWDEQHYKIYSVPFEIRRLLKRNPTLHPLAKRVVWPLSPPNNHHTMLLAHAFDRSISTTTRSDGANFGIGSSSAMTVKYTAYNVLCTSLFLLTEDGKVTVMDIETGQVTGMIDNVAATAAARMDPSLSSSGRVRGIDVNVVSGHEVVVTSREGLLRSSMS